MSGFNDNAKNKLVRRVIVQVDNKSVMLDNGVVIMLSDKIVSDLNLALESPSPGEVQQAEMEKPKEVEEESTDELHEGKS